MGRCFRLVSLLLRFSLSPSRILFTSFYLPPFIHSTLFSPSALDSHSSYPGADADADADVRDVSQCAPHDARVDASAADSAPFCPPFLP
jgi:hypothetical protein